jgi:hypothetical protein
MFHADSWPAPFEEYSGLYHPGEIGTGFRKINTAPTGSDGFLEVGAEQW